MRSGILLLFFLSMTSVEAAIKKVASGTEKPSIRKYEIIDIVFKSEGKIDNPFKIVFNALFVSPSGKQQTVPAFYNGNGEWIVRFSAGETGSWNYKVESGHKSFDKKNGIVHVVPEQYMERKGAVTLNKEYPRHFFWEDKSPYFLMGFECDFLFALDYHSKSSTPRLDGFLDGVKMQGFNHLVMNVYANDVVWKKDEKLKHRPEYEFGNDTTIFPFQGSNEQPDYSALNVNFFKHLDRTVEALNERNIISNLMIYVWNKNVRWPAAGSEADNLYFDYVVKRYQAFSNIVWDISKEAILYGNVDDTYILERISRLRKMDSFKRLMTVHDFGFCNRNKEAVDFVSHQDWKLGLYADMLRNYEKFKDCPVYNIEHGGYEECDYEVFCGNYINAEACLRRNYECAFAGTYSTYYWQGCSWNVLIYDWDKLPKNSYRPKFDYFKHLVGFFEKYSFHEFRPVPEYNNSGYCMTDDRGTYLFYLPKESYKVSAGKIMKKAKKISFQWYNTHTGDWSDVIKEDKMVIFSMPASPWHMKNDVILILKVLESK